MDTLVETLRRVKRKWEKQLWFHTYFFRNVFSRGKNLASSYGFVMKCMGSLLAFEHESMRWRMFLLLPQKKLCAARLISGGCDGLLLCERKKCLITNNPIWERRVIWSGHDQKRICLQLGVWNPLIRAFKWLPLHPKLTNRSWSEYCGTRHHVMVNDSSRTFKVFIYYKSESRPLRWLYSIYSSTNQAWSDIHPLPPVGSFSYPRFSVASGRYVCIVVNCYPWGETHAEDYLCCYDTERLCWCKLLLSEPLTDLAFSQQSWALLLSVKLASFAIFRGLLYMVVHVVTPGDKNHEHVEPLLASLDLSTLAARDTISNLVLKLESVIS